MLDEDEPVPAPDLLQRKILRNAIVDLLFITKGQSLETLKSLYRRHGFYDHDLSLLRNRAWHKRLGAIVRLDQWRSIVPNHDLEFLMDDENKDVRIHAMKALSMARDPEIAQNILTHLKNSRIDLSIRYECLSRLLLNHRSLILQTLLDKNWSELSPHIIKVLGDRRDIAAVPFIMDAAVIEEVNLRESAFDALGKIGDPRSISFLLAGMDSDHYRVRLAALKALYEVDEDLFRSHREDFKADPDPLVRAWTQHFLREKS